MICGIFKAVGL